MGGICGDAKGMEAEPIQKKANTNKLDMRDYLNNRTIQKEMNGEQIVWSSAVDKVNHRTGLKETRDILLTDKHFYNIKNESTIQRKVRYSKIIGITRSEVGTCLNFVIHFCDKEKDYLY